MMEITLSGCGSSAVGCAAVSSRHRPRCRQWCAQRECWQRAPACSAPHAHDSAPSAERVHVPAPHDSEHDELSGAGGGGDGGGGTREGSPLRDITHVTFSWTTRDT